MQEVVVVVVVVAVVVAAAVAAAAPQAWPRWSRCVSRVPEDQRGGFSRDFLDFVTP